MNAEVAEARQSFGKTMEKHRMSQGMTQLEVGEKCGIHHTTVSAIARGKNTVSRELAEKMADVLGLSPNSRRYLVSMAKKTYARKPSEEERARLRKQATHARSFQSKKPPQDVQDEPAPLSDKQGATTDSQSTPVSIFLGALRAQGVDPESIGATLGYDGGAVLVTRDGRVLNMDVSIREFELKSE